MKAAEMVLITHQRHRGGCLCGWAELGKSLPGHQAAMLREAGLLSNDPEAVMSELPKMPKAECVFCDIVAGRAPAQIFHEWDDALAFVPLNPVTEGHLLVIPKVHVADVGHDPSISAATMQRAAQLAAAQWCNVITSRGRVATQSIFHLHFHIVPRRESDGLALPWTEVHV